MNFGQFLVDYRTSKNMLQKEFAANLNISQPYLSLIENGHLKPGIILLYRISIEMKMPINAMLYKILGINLKKKPHNAVHSKQVHHALMLIMDYMMDGKKKSPTVRLHLSKKAIR